MLLLTLETVGNSLSRSEKACKRRKQLLTTACPVLTMTGGFLVSFFSITFSLIVNVKLNHIWMRVETDVQCCEETCCLWLLCMFWFTLSESLVIMVGKD